MGLSGEILRQLAKDCANIPKRVGWQSKKDKIWERAVILLSAVVLGNWRTTKCKLLIKCGGVNISTL